MKSTHFYIKKHRKIYSKLAQLVTYRDQMVAGIKITDFLSLEKLFWVLEHLRMLCLFKAKVNES